MIQSKVFAKIKTDDLLDEFNTFMRENGIERDSIVHVEYNNNIIFFMWDDHNKDYLEQLNKNPVTVDPKFNGSDKESETYIDTGCE
jgi:hypothetical protein